MNNRRCCCFTTPAGWMVCVSCPTHGHPHPKQSHTCKPILFRPDLPRRRPKDTEDTDS